MGTHSTAGSRPRLTGRRVAVTGAAQGIGRSTAELLLREGALVAIGDLDLERARRTAAEHSESTGGRCVAWALDVADEASFAAFLDAAVAEFDGLDVLVNNAGIMPIGPFLDESDGLTRRAVDIDLNGVLTGTKLAGRYFTSRRSGHVVNVASVLGTIASPNAATYCATKYAVVGLGESLRQEWHGTGLDITTVCPGFVRTELIAGMSANAAMERYLMVDPGDVAVAITESIVARRSRTVFVPGTAGLASRGSANLPVRLRDWLFRVSGGTKVTTDLDLTRRAEYDNRISR